MQCYDLILTGEVVARWELFVDGQSRLETPDGTDLDNFAKLLNDSIKGAGRILIDDSRIQRLDVAWISTRSEPCFELTIECRPDDWSSKPISLYGSVKPPKRWSVKRVNEPKGRWNLSTISSRPHAS